MRVRLPSEVGARLARRRRHLHQRRRRRRRASASRCSPGTIGTARAWKRSCPRVSKCSLTAALGGKWCHGARCLIACGGREAARTTRANAQSAWRWSPLPIARFAARAAIPTISTAFENGSARARRTRARRAVRKSHADRRGSGHRRPFLSWFDFKQPRARDKKRGARANTVAFRARRNLSSAHPPRPPDADPLYSMSSSASSPPSSSGSFVYHRLSGSSQ